MIHPHSLVQRQRALFGALMLSLALSFGLPAWSQELWNGVSVGMSVPQVVQAHPGAAPNPFPEELYGGAKDILVDPHHEFAGAIYAVRYFFDGEELIQVTLTLDKTTVRNRHMKARFKAVLAELSAEFGPPDHLEYPIDRKFDDFNASWAQDPRRISILAYGNGSKLLNVNFQDAAYWEQ